MNKPSQAAAAALYRKDEVMVPVIYFKTLDLFIDRIQFFFRAYLKWIFPLVVLFAASTSLAHAEPTVFLSQTAHCDGTTDDWSALNTAVNGAQNNAYILDIDCPIFVHIGIDVARPIFIGTFTTINFTGTGKITTDNLMVPAFAIADSSHVSLNNWNILWKNQFPVSGYAAVPGGYGFVEDGVPYISPKQFAPSLYFGARTLANYMHAAHGVIWNGMSPAVDVYHASALFYIYGNVSYVAFNGLTAAVPPNAPGSNYIPMVFGTTIGEANNQARVAGQLLTYAPPLAAEPHQISITNATLDGTIFGWQGQASEVQVNGLKSYRYSDLQDPSGGNVGGVGKWFAPPHLFYLDYINTSDPSFWNHNINISNVIDYGIRTGVARDVPGQPQTGYDLSLKLGCQTCTVTNYQSYRPDGFMDVLGATNLTVSNVTATYNSQFLNYLYPCLRFPGGYGYHNINFHSITLTDLAPLAPVTPIQGDLHDPTTTDVVFTNTKATLTEWTGTGWHPYTSWIGIGDSINIVFDYDNGSMTYNELLQN